MTFSEAVLAAIEKSPEAPYRKRQMRDNWMAADPDTLSNAKARLVSDQILGKTNSVRLKVLLTRPTLNYAPHNYLLF